MSGIYEAPGAELSEDLEGSEFGSVERGISGEYDLTVGGIFSEARARLNGSKGTAWAAVGLMLVAIIAIQIAVGFVVGLLPISPTISVVVSQIAPMLLTTPITIGAALVGVKLAAGANASGTSIFNHFDVMVKLFLQVLLMYILIAVGFVLLVIPGIYLSISYIFASMLLVEKNMSIWEALETSRKAVTRKWFTVFFYALLIGIVVMVSALPLLIGLIWTVPLAMLCYGVVYKTMFGVERSTLESE